MDTNKIFGIDTFDKKQMKDSLPFPIYQKWKNAVRKEDLLDIETAEIIAHAMKKWAIERGATHFCHWFQPLNGLTAKKHDSFLDRGDDNTPINRFSAKELIKGEPDASSFPTGSIRSTFEARGYTYWDCTSNTFIVDNIMYIPSVFVSYDGTTLDKKLPLLKSLDYLSDYATKLYNEISDDHCYRMKVKIGLEQEFFLIDENVYKQRIDLINTGRTLLGAQAPKSQELTDHYFGSIPQRVEAFYKDFDEKLFRLGIYAKTEHNEVAPNQFEVAILFENANISVDDNHLVMEILKTTARKHHLVCLLHEKPFKGVNGSGKHNNYSLVTNHGRNVFSPKADMENDLVFLIFTACLIEAVDKSQALLRSASSTTSNDYRLGGDEAPPSIISMDLGQDIEETFNSLMNEEEIVRNYPEFSINRFDYIPPNMTDRNRTSPFAFSGNKFEFRMLGSSNSASDVNIVLNTMYANAIKRVYEKYKSQNENIEQFIKSEVVNILKNHKHILYRQDNYTELWREEAKKRGLLDLVHYFDSLYSLISKESIKDFCGILSEEELHAIYDVGLEDVITTHEIEAKTLIYMLDKFVINAFSKQLIQNSNLIKKCGINSLDSTQEKLKNGLNEIIDKRNNLEEMIQKSDFESKYEKAKYFQYEISPLIEEIREIHDGLEKFVYKENYSLCDIQDIYSSLI